MLVKSNCKCVYAIGNKNVIPGGEAVEFTAEEVTLYQVDKIIEAGELVDVTPAVKKPKAE